MWPLSGYVYYSDLQKLAAVGDAMVRCEWDIYLVGEFLVRLHNS